jgi:hypothetical protein
VKRRLATLAALAFVVLAAVLWLVRTDGGEAADAVATPSASSEAAATVGEPAPDMPDALRLEAQVAERAPTAVAAPPSNASPRTAPQPPRRVEAPPPPKPIEVHVWRDGQPTPDLEVRLELIEVAPEGEAAAKSTHFALTDSRGRALFPALAFESAVATVMWDGRAGPTLNLIPPAAEGSPRYYLRFGSGRIEGVVRDSSGLPLPGANVSLRSDSAGLILTTTAGGDGRYAFDNVAAGFVWVSTTAAAFGRSEMNHLRVHLPPMQVVQFDVNAEEILERVTELEDEYRRRRELLLGDDRFILRNKK